MRRREFQSGGARLSYVDFGDDGAVLVASPDRFG